MLDGPQSNLGYHAIWHDLQMKGIRVPRNTVAIGSLLLLSLKREKLWDGNFFTKESFAVRKKILPQERKFCLKK